MFPYIYLFGKQIAVYGLMALCGIFAAGIIACKRAKKAGLDDTDMMVMLLAAGAGAFLGGHILYALVQYRFLPRLFDAESARMFFLRFAFIFGGQVFYGGLAGGLAAGSVCGRLKFQNNFSLAADTAAPVIPLFHVFGRTGCFFGGCCFGVESRFGIVFTEAIIPEANGTGRLPVQLIEASFNLGLFFLLSKFSASRTIMARLRGKLLFCYLLLYPAGRFILEFFRGDAYRGFWAPLSTSQWISIFFAGFALVMLLGFVPNRKQPGRRIVLLGPKHSGKSGAGMLLAEKLKLPFYDLDKCIEEKTGKSPRALYGEGENVFRAAETEALKSLYAETGNIPALVLAAGGGIIDNPEAAALLRQKGAVLVYLAAGTETAWERIVRGGLPPFLTGQKDDPKEVHRLLHKRRAKAYRALAGIVIETEGKTPETIAGEIAALV